ncbi:MAG: hypothetical protein MUF21_08175 [Gemmatimonadaceae bacterium]|jgi:hypothetical protein|nr:hypothetical protein [Gemmatimonadaceae bacterium]
MPRLQIASLRPTPFVQQLRRAALVAAALVVPALAQAQLRVIVNRSYPDTDVSMRDLTRLFRGEYGSLANGQRAVLAEQATARARYVRTVTGMDDDTFRRHWIRIVFAGAPVAPPRGFPDAETACAFVARTPGALAIVEGRCGDDVKTLTVNGRQGGDAQYPLR